MPAPSEADGSIPSDPASMDASSGSISARWDAIPPGATIRAGASSGSVTITLPAGTEVTGSAWMSGEHRFVLDERDPLGTGFLLRFALPIIALLVALGGCSRGDWHLTGATMGTTYSVRIVAPETDTGAKELQGEIDAELSRITALMSTACVRSAVSFLT